MSNYLVHYGTPRHSGRYPWGSGKEPYQSLIRGKSGGYNLNKEKRYSKINRSSEHKLHKYQLKKTKSKTSAARNANILSTINPSLGFAYTVYNRLFDENVYRAKGRSKAALAVTGAQLLGQMIGTEVVVPTIAPAVINAALTGTNPALLALAPAVTSLSGLAAGTAVSKSIGKAEEHKLSKENTYTDNYGKRVDEYYRKKERDRIRKVIS